MDSLIDVISRTWNLQVIRTLVDPHDVKIIEIIPLRRLPTGDRDGCHFTNNGRYTVKCDYQVKRVYPNRERTLLEYVLRSYCPSVVWSFGRTFESFLLESTLYT